MTEFLTTAQSTIADLGRRVTKNSRPLTVKRSAQLVRPLQSQLDRVREQDPRTPPAAQYGYGVVRMETNRVFREIDSLGRLHLVDVISSDAIHDVFAYEIDSVSPGVVFPGIFPGQVIADGTIASGRFSQTGADQPNQPLNSKIRLFDGRHTTNPEIALETSLTDSFIGRGHAYVWTRLTFKDGLFSSDPTVRVIAKARRCVDPRTVSPGAAFADQPKAFSINPYVFIFDYLLRPETLGGAGRSVDEVDINAFSQGADWAEMVVDAKQFSRIAVLTERTNQFIGNPPINTNHVLEFNEAVIPFQYGDVVRINVTGSQSLPANLQQNVDYHVIPIRDRINEFQLPGIALAASLEDALAGISIPQGNRVSDITVTKVGEIRYQSGVVYRSGERVLEEMLRSCGARLFLDNGKLSVTIQTFPSGEAVDSVALDELYGPISLSTSIDSSDRATALTGSFTSMTRLYEPRNYPLVSGGGVFAAQEGKDIIKTFDLGFIAKASIAQREATIELRKRRLETSVAFSGLLELYRLKPGKIFHLNFEKNGLDENTTFQVRSQTLFTRIRDGKPSVLVDIEGRQLEAGVFDLDVSNEEFVDNAKIPGLESPFDVAPPGNLTITEQPLVTNEAAGVRFQATISWVASSSLFVENYEVSFKLSAQTAFTIAQVTPELTISVPDLAPNDYDFRVVAINSVGRRSVAAEVNNFQIQGLLARPSAPTNLEGAVLGVANVQLTWDLSPDLDVRQGGTIEVRHNSQIVGGDPKDAIFIRADVGAQRSLAVPFKQGTYYLFFIDSTGNRSDAASWSTQSRRPIGIAAVLPGVFGDPLDTSNTNPDTFTLQEDNTFPSTNPANTLIFVTDHLELPLTQTLDDEPDFDAIPNIDEVGGGDVTPEGLYFFSTAVQVNEKTRIVVEAVLEQEIFDLTSSIDDEPDWDAIPNIDDVAAGLLAPGLATAEIQVRFSDGTIASDTFGPWEKVDTQVIEARSFEFRILARTTKNTVNIRINQARVRMLAAPLA